MTAAALALALAAASATGGSPREAQPPPAEWRTRAEASGFAATSSYGETLDLLQRLAARDPRVHVSSFGTSAEGRPLPLVILSTDRAFTPGAARATGKPVVLVQNGIHGGEIDGKDASLMLLRDVVLGLREAAWIDELILLVVPIYNVDGHERVSPFHRPNQNGPVAGMGFRTTADGHDLNRDHVKLETPEARSMIALFNAWRPDLHVDNHVTDGSRHDWVLTWSWVEAPQVAASLDRWLGRHMPRVAAATLAAGHRNGPYVSLRERDDPTRGFSSYVGQSRYATGYYPLRHCPSILVENHSYAPYRQRVRANRDFMLALFEEVARDPGALRDAVTVAQEQTVARGRPDASPSELVLRWSEEDTGETVAFPLRAWTVEPSMTLGVPMVRYRPGTVPETEVPWIHRSRAERSVARPRGYLVLPGWPVIERRLHDHGLRVLRLDRAVTLEVETLHVAGEPGSLPGPSYQGLTRVIPRVTRRLEPVDFPAGTLWIPADQRDFEVAAQLLEPEAPDSLLAWGLLSTVLERKEYIDSRVLEELARQMLDDPAVTAEWARALEDPAFAGDPDARWLWWYRRTPYRDATEGRMPVMRLHGSPDDVVVSPWNGPPSPLPAR